MILVTGATGHVGGEVVRALSAAGQPTRALVRSPERADDLRGYDVDVAVGDLAHPESLDDALRGVDVALLVAPPVEGQVALETGFIDAAARAPQRPHVVKLAALGFDPAAQSRFPRTHGQVVEALNASGLGHTVLAPTSFMQNLLTSAGTIATQSALYLPAGDAKVSHVDVRDIAAVAVAALTDPDAHRGQVYELTGPAALTYGEVAAALSELLGRQVSYVDLPPEQARAAMTGAGMPQYLADGLLELFEGYRAGAAEAVSPAVEQVTGRPPRDLATFLHDHAAAFRSV